MAFKPNYNHQRAERDRLKQAKKNAKLREKEDARERQRATQDASAAASEGSGGEPSASQLSVELGAMTRRQVWA